MPALPNTPNGEPFHLYNNPQKAEENFWWWLNKAKSSLQLTHAPELQSLLDLQLFAIKQAAEYAFKAVIIVFTGRVIKTHNLCTLLPLAVVHLPDISQVFPKDTPAEKMLFHWLTQPFSACRGIEILPDEEELNLLLQRVTGLLQTVETGFKNAIQSLP